MKQLPAKDHVQEEPKGLLKALRRLLPSELSSSDGRGSESRCGSSEGRTTNISALNHNRRARIGTHDGDDDVDESDGHHDNGYHRGGESWAEDEEEVALEFPSNAHDEVSRLRAHALVKVHLFVLRCIFLA